MIVTVNQDALARAIDHWENTAPIHTALNLAALTNHLNSEYGIKLGGWQGLEPEAEVVDEKKYIVFLLKFS